MMCPSDNSSCACLSLLFLASAYFPLQYHIRYHAAAVAFNHPRFVLVCLCCVRSRFYDYNTVIAMLLINSNTMSVHTRLLWDICCLYVLRVAVFSSHGRFASRRTNSNVTYLTQWPSPTGESAYLWDEVVYHSSLIVRVTLFSMIRILWRDAA